MVLWIVSCGREGIGFTGWSCECCLIYYGSYALNEEAR